jgi:hypothetical protein
MYNGARSIATEPIIARQMLAMDAGQYWREYMKDDELIQQELKVAMAKEGYNPLTTAFGTVRDLQNIFDDRDLREDKEASWIIPGDRVKVTEEERVHRAERKKPRTWVETVREEKENAAEWMTTLPTQV